MKSFSHTKRVLLCTVAAGLVLSGCVSQSKFDELLKERDGLLSQKQGLEKDVAEHRSKLSSTSEELEAVKAKAAEQEEMYAKLKKELSSELDNKQLTLRQLKNGISVDLPEDILFPSGSADLREGGRVVLAKVSTQLKDIKYQIMVSGYTDNEPISGKLAQRFPTNWHLAAARATNVVHLLEQSKVPAKKMVAMSYGDNNPVATNKTPEGRKKNRRIEIHLRPEVKD